MNYQAGNTTIIVKRGDITEEETGAIVNAANSELLHGAGVAGAIVHKGGQTIQEESDRIGHVPVGSAAITTGGNLKAPFVIHAVGPRMGEGNEDEKLRMATANCLRLADSEGIRTISFPAISTGIFGYPIGRCAEVMLQAVHQYCEGETRIQEVHFCLFDESAEKIFESTAKRIFTTPS